MQRLMKCILVPALAAATQCVTERAGEHVALVQRSAKAVELRGKTTTTVTHAPIELADNAGNDIFIGTPKDFNDGDAESVLADAFDAYDTDNTGFLNAHEMQQVLFDSSKLHDEMKNNNDEMKNNVSGKAAQVPLSEAEHLVDLYDTDKDGKCSKDEFLAALDVKHKATHAALLQADGTVATRVLGMSECLMDVAEQVWDVFGCLHPTSVQVCDWWKPWNCFWNVVTTVVGCFITQIKQVGAAFGDCFNMVIDAVTNAASSASKGFMKLLPNDCNSWEGCLDELLAGPKAVLDAAGEAVAAAGSAIIAGLTAGINEVTDIFGKTASVIQDVGSVVSKTVGAIKDFVEGSAAAISGHMAVLPNVCSPDGEGFWKIEMTDCGGFAALGKTVTEAFSTNILQTPANFAATVKSFGQCILKTGIFHLPSPFMNIGVEPFCIPEWIQNPVKGIIGTFNYFVDQVKAVGTGCQFHKAGDQPICELAADMNQIGVNMKNIFNKEALLQAASKTHALLQTGSGSLANKTANFRTFLRFGIQVSFPNPGVIVGGAANFETFLGFEAAINWKGGVPDFDFSLSLELEKTELGLPAGIKLGPSVGVGFDTDAWPKAGVVRGSSSFIVGGTDISPISPRTFGIPVPDHAGTKLAFRILPDIGSPSGFTVWHSATIPTPPKYYTGYPASLLEERVAMARSVQAAVDQIEGHQEKVLGAIVGFTKALAHMDIAAHIFDVVPEPHSLLQQGGAAAVKAHEMAKTHVLIPKLNSGVGFLFCLTCDPTPEEAAGGATPPPVAGPTPPPTPMPTPEPPPVVGKWTVTRQRTKGQQKPMTKVDEVCGLDTDEFSIACQPSNYCSDKFNGADGQTLVNQYGQAKTWAWFCCEETQGTTEVLSATFIADGEDGDCVNQHDVSDDGS